MRTNTPATLRGTISTLGYSQYQATATLERLLRQPHIPLLDVCYQPTSRRHIQWNRAELAARYGQEYRWERRLGNVNYWSQTRPIQLPAGHEQALREAVDLLCAGTSLVLLCCCGDELTCHRTLVARLIQDALPAPQAAQEVLA